MQSAVGLRLSIVPSLLLMVIGPSPGAGDAGPAAAVAASAVASMSRAAGVRQQFCPEPNAYCANTHGGVATAYCEREACFEMNRGDAVRVVAADDLGEFPRTWFAWDDEDQVTVAGGSCVITEQGKRKMRVDFPDGWYRCRLDLTAGEYVYYEHFASNPESGCLGWLECRVPLSR